MPSLGLLTHVVFRANTTCCLRYSQVFLYPLFYLISPANHQSWQGSFSNESIIQTTPNSPDYWIFREPEHKYDRKIVNSQEYVKAEMSFIIWGMIWLGGRSILVIMERDLESPRQGYSAKSYIMALEEGLLPNYKPGHFSFTRQRSYPYGKGGQRLARVSRYLGSKSPCPEPWFKPNWARLEGNESLPSTWIPSITPPER